MLYLLDRYTRFLEPFILFLKGHQFDVDIMTVQSFSFEIEKLFEIDYLFLKFQDYLSVQAIERNWLDFHYNLN